MARDWATSTLGSVASISIGRTPSRTEPTYWTADLARPFCSITDMTSGTVIPSREGVTAAAVRAGKAKLVPKGSLLMSFKLTVGRVGVAGCDLYPNEAIAWIKPTSDDVLQSFLGYALESIDYTNRTSAAVKGATLNAKSLAALPIPTPSLRTQIRVVDLMAAADAACDASARRETAAWRALDAVLDAEGERVNLGSGTTRLGTVITTNPQQLSGREKLVVRYVALSDVGYRTTIGPLLGARVQLGDASSRARRLTAPGDVLLSTVRPGLRGSARVVDSTGLVASTGFVVLRARRERLDDAYLYGLATAPRFATLLSQLAVGSTYPAVKASDVAGVCLDLPPISEQLVAVERFESLAAYAEACSTAHTAAVAARTNLLHALLSGSHRIPDAYDQVLG